MQMRINQDLTTRQYTTPKYETATSSFDLCLPSILSCLPIMMEMVGAGGGGVSLPPKLTSMFDGRAVLHVAHRAGFPENGLCNVKGLILLHC